MLVHIITRNIAGSVSSTELAIYTIPCMYSSLRGASDEAKSATACIMSLRIVGINNTGGF